MQPHEVFTIDNILYLSLGQKALRLQSLRSGVRHLASSLQNPWKIVLVNTCGIIEG